MVAASGVRVAEVAAASAATVARRRAHGSEDDVTGRIARARGDVVPRSIAFEPWEGDAPAAAAGAVRPRAVGAVSRADRCGGW